MRSSLLTLNDANRTGNYSVLRDTAGPSFRAGNTTERLARIFAGLKRSRLDLSPVALVAPTLDVAPFVDRNRRLRIKGAFALSAQRIAFDLAYEPAGGEWQLFAISIGARPLGGAGSGSNPG